MISDLTIKIFGASVDTSSGDKYILFDETIKHPKLKIIQLGVVGEDGYGGIIEIFDFEVAYKNTEPKERIELNTNDFTTEKLMKLDKCNNETTFDSSNEQGKTSNVSNRVSKTLQIPPKCGLSKKIYMCDFHFRFIFERVEHD